MRKLVALLLAAVLTVAMVCGAYSLYDDPIALKITPIDPVTGYAVTNPTYTANTLFCLRIDVGVPRFAKTDNLEIEIEVCGVDVTEQNLKMQDGVYYIKGIVRSQPASLTVRIIDNALKNAETAEDYYIASKIDRSVRETFTFGGVQVAPSNNASVTILPKTGDAISIGLWLILMVIIVGAISLIIHSSGRRRNE